MIIRKVKRVITPNLIELESGDTVRLISVDDASVIESDEEQGIVGSLDFLTGLVAGEYVKIEFDKRMLDPDCNLLAYVFKKTSKSGDPVWSMINKRLIVLGYCDYRMDFINRTHSLKFEFLKETAQLEERGIWAKKD